MPAPTRKFVTVPLTEDEKTRWEKAAGAIPVSRWVRDIVNRELAKTK